MKISFSIILVFVFSSWVLNATNTQLGCTGNWTKRGTTYNYGFEMSLDIDADNNIKGVIQWTLISADRNSSRSYRRQKSKIGKTALAFVKGEYSPIEGTYTFATSGQFDPNEIIGDGIYQLTVNKGKVKGKSKTKRTTYQENGGIIKGQLKDVSEDALLASNGIHLDRITTKEYIVGDANSDNILGLGETGYLCYSLLYQGQSGYLPKGIKVFVSGSEGAAKPFGDRYHLFRETITAGKVKPRYLLRFKRDSTASSNGFVSIDLKVDLFGVYEKTIATKKLGLINEYPKYLSCGGNPAVPMTDFYGTYIGSNQDSQLEIMANQTFTFSSQGEQIKGKWSLEKRVDDAFVSDEPPIQIATFNWITFYDINLSTSPKITALFREKNRVSTLLTTSGLPEYGQISLKEKRNYLRFYKMNKPSSVSAELESIRKSFVGKWFSTEIYDEDLYQFQADGTVYYRDDENRDDKGKWRILSEKDQFGNVHYFILLYQFKKKSAKRLLVLTERTTIERIQLFNGSASKFSEEKVTSLIKDNSIQFSN